MTDPFGRSIDYLRLSITDQCNLRCAYCLPAGHLPFAARSSRLTPGEIERLAACFVALGVRRVRLTGGEPLVREDLEEIVERLARAGVADLSLSTNGIGLARRAAGLRKAGLRRVNVSLDSLDPARFAELTRHGRLSDVLAGVEAALSAGLEPVKLNVVVVRGVNDGELAAFAELSRDRPFHVRFIELMPMGVSGFYAPERRVPLPEMRLKTGALEAAGDSRPEGGGPAAYYRLPGAVGTVGFIAALSCSFCAGCNRMRLTSRGVLVPCLDGEEGLDLAALVRGGASPDEVRDLIVSAVGAKPAAHAMLGRSEGGGRTMCHVGG
ncbi:MAG: GTP 3',8-cyclase MoaA [Elusimicrobia bacterium]|nr:GTP 3',8-cyclase MoaA [Elusimicrobiota bacterium]